MTTQQTPAPEEVDSIDPAPAPDKRYRVKLTQTNEVYECLPCENMLQGMARLGRRGIPIGCLNGGCGICKVAVVAGEWEKTGLMSRAHVSEEEEARGIVLACRAAPSSDVDIEVLGKMQKSVFKGWG
ncbi:MAG: 2Fe-2S iron-sulfur cluster-binding protein [Rugosibacter sp.]|nr:2Fe-2S iron-sulfur cluster-binding protein [Rugosibacter sp.]